MRFTPSSWGAERPVREFNPHHEPAGTSKGGQKIGGRFAKKPAGDTYVATTGLSGQAALDKETMLRTGVIGTSVPTPDGPPPDEPGVIFKEPPKSKVKKAPGPDGGHRVYDRADEAIASALGIEDPEALAEQMFSEISSESFTITIETSGDTGGTGPDPSYERRNYENYVEEAASEAEQAAYESARRSYMYRAKQQMGMVGAAYSEVAQEYADRFVFLPSAFIGDMAPADAKAMETASKDLYEQSLRLLGDEGQGDGILNEEGYLSGPHRSREAMLKEAIRTMFEAALDDGITTLPKEFHGGFDSDDLARHSKYFNSDDGFDKWVDDGQNDIEDAVLSFDDWYEREYGVSVDDWDSGGEVDSDSARLKISAKGNKGTYIERSFNFKDGRLHVHHDYFSIGDRQDSGEGLGKDLFRGSMKAYKEIGLELITVYANIDMGGYSWARYGFVAESPSGTRYAMEGQIRTLIGNGVLREDEGNRILAAISPKDPQNVWEMSDTRLRVGRTRAMAALSELRRVGNDKKTLTYNDLLRKDAEQGFINIGKVVMANMTSWDGLLDLSDEAQMARLRDYLGWS